MSSSTGTLFRVTTFGESHGPGLGAVVDGCPARLPLAQADIQAALDRRRPGQNALSTPRNEADTVEILSGVFDGLTLGTPIALLVRNHGQRSADYAPLAEIYRPSHADYTTEAKYGIRDPRGGGRASARETIGRVAAGAIAAKWLFADAGIEIRAYVESVHDVCLPREILAGLAAPDAPLPTLAQIDANPARCPHTPTAERIAGRIAAARAAGDSLGGVIRCRVRGVPPGLGEPVFDRIEALLAKAVLSLPACKGFDIGSGFAGATMRGSEHNDPFEFRDGVVRTTTNHSGGVQGGISNGEEISFRAAFKPVPSIALSQQSITRAGIPTELSIQGRHDPCVLPRAVPIVEAVTALTLADLCLRARAETGFQRKR
ncbi:MAG: chorismate synthase [Puniceicoccales bacterium]|jgi:chorismate synthase|nr:chorismate synthase [Puniceicoccales bacterium]